MESDDEHFDDRSPVGQIITHINKLCKKPQIDDQLQKALQRFNAHMDQQKQYLANGVFSINFAEAALFIQSCTTLYGKKVDLLWDELLVLHTRLIEYDCDHEKKKGTKLDEEVIKKLEERRNRYKRKKKFKLSLEQDQAGINLFDKPLTDVPQYAPDENITKKWKRIEYEGNEHSSIPHAVYKQQAKMYRMKNYPLLKCEDFDVMDLDDDEFNTKYSRIPSWHVINHLIEYNNQGLLPDKENCIAKLKLMMYGRLKFLDMNKIPVNTPFKEYAKEYMIYRQKFFEKEAKKWQNMPLDTMADLHKQLLFLARREKLASAKSCQSPMPKVFPGIIHCCEDSKSSMASSCDSCIDITISSDKEFLKSDLYVNLEQLSSEVISTKLRQDSGYYDFEEIADDDDMDIEQIEGQAEGQNQVEGQSQDKEQTAGVETSITQTEGQTEGLSQEKEQTEGQSQDKEQTEGQSQSEGQAEGQSQDKEQTEGQSQDKEQTEGQNQDKEQTEGQSQSEGQVEGQSQDETQTEGMDTAVAQSEGQTEGQSQDKEQNGSQDQSEGGIEGQAQGQTPETQEKEQPAQIEGQNVAEGVQTESGEQVAGSSASMTGVADDSTRTTMDKENSPPPELQPYYADDKDDDCRSIVSDHDYCADASNTILGELNRNRNKESIARKMAREMPPPLTPVFGGSRIIAKPIRLREKRTKEPKAKENNEGPMPKVRKLSQKQLEKLKNNLVIAEKVRMTKFEKFFARNYQTQMGEGETQAMSSDSESEVDELPEPPPEDVQNAETASVMSDHSYCQPQEQSPDKLHDSGFHDESPLDESGLEVEPTAEEAGLTVREETEGVAAVDDGRGSVAESVVEGRRRRREAVVDPMEEQIQEALRKFRESRRTEEEYVRKTAESIARHEMTEEELVQSRQRVENWRSHITPILKGLSESEFDIHEYGSAIMEGVDVGEKKPFKEVVQGKPPSEVVRYFISSLQLANTGNIDICGVQPGRLSNESFEVKLLTKERYHEHLNEFHAPSEEERKAKMKKIKEIRDKDQSEEPPEKQPKQSARGKTPLNSTRCYTKSSRKLTATPTQEQQLPTVRICLERLQPPTSLPTAPPPMSTPPTSTPLPAISTPPTSTPLPSNVQRITTPQAPLRNAPPTLEEDLATPSTSRAYFDEFLQSQPVDRQLFSTPLSDRPPAVGRGGPAPKVRHRLFE
ncbi:unnamed protein product [Callosobruchus maculatus]|uniref:Condensin-2 complex subunit H2 C-terminal domain-containing protein n=2 Tax=Callosobruchus maculatus TaxID=64391 RepID=A0A653BDX1_CALMS|nr:unnamed protein product [Callosobruchus maculatus]